MRATWLSGYMAALHLNFGLDSFTPAQGVLALRASPLHRWWKTSCPPQAPCSPSSAEGRFSCLRTPLSIFSQAGCRVREALLAGGMRGEFSFFDQCFLPLPCLRPCRKEWATLGQTLEWRGRGETKQERGKGRGEVCGGERVPWGKVARLGGYVTGRAKRGKLQWSKEVKGNFRNRGIGMRNWAKIKGGQHWLLGVLRDNKNNEKVRKIKRSRYKRLDCSELTHKVPMASPRDGDQPPHYPTNHNFYPPLRGLVSSGGVNVIFPYSCPFFHASWGGCLFCLWL